MKKWSEKEIDKLIELSNMGLTDMKIAEIINQEFNIDRTPNSIEHKRESLFLMKDLNINKKKDINMDFLDNNKDLVIKFLKKNIFKDSPIENMLKLSKDDRENWIHEEKCVLVLSDVHCGMINKIFNKNSYNEMVTYNSIIREKEMLTLRDNIAKIKILLRHSYDLNHLTILNLGDMVTNDRIFSGQLFHVDKCVGLQVIEMVKDLTFFIKEMKKLFSKITFVGIVGNHGRSTNDSNFDEPIENNYEYILYKMIESIFEGDKTIEIIIPNTKFYMHKIYEHKYLLTHGDLVRGFTRNTIEKSIKDYVIANESDFDVFIMGHLHRIDEMTLSEHNVALINGSWIEKDNYGFKVARQFSKPQQIFFGVSRKRAITWKFHIDLKE